MFESQSFAIPLAAAKYRRQTTLKKPVEFAGIGIHSGKNVTMRFVPAKEGTGILFKRVDLPGQPVIPATVEYVTDISRSTNLGLGDVRIITAEHVLAALRAYEIDNLIVELSAVEPPVGNGSSDVFVEMIENSGIQYFNEQIPVLRLQEPIYHSLGDIHLIALPSDEYRISYTLDYPNAPALKSQYFTVEVTPQNFKTEISPCRTFCLYHELSYLMDKGLIKGGSLDNAVVIKEDAILSKNGLFFPNEMARHKILDIIGDLSLVGFNFLAHIIAIKSGHATNVALAQKLYQSLTMERV